MLFLSTISLSAQNLDYLKARDTIYFSFRELSDKSTEKKIFEYFEWQNYGDDVLSEYEIKEKDSLRIINIRVSKSSESSIEVNRKEFLKKYKNCIIDLKFIAHYQPKELFFNFLGARAYAPSAKVIYVIDEESLKKKKKKIILRKAYLVTIGYLQI